MRHLTNQEIQYIGVLRPIIFMASCEREDKYRGEDDDLDEQVDETLDKPRDPIHWCAQTHHLHGFL